MSLLQHDLFYCWILIHMKELVWWGVMMQVKGLQWCFQYFCEEKFLQNFRWCELCEVCALDLLTHASFNYLCFWTATEYLGILLLTLPLKSTFSLNSISCLYLPEISIGVLSAPLHIGTGFQLYLPVWRYNSPDSTDGRVCKGRPDSSVPDCVFFFLPDIHVKVRYYGYSFGHIHLRTTRWQ